MEHPQNYVNSQRLLSASHVSVSSMGQEKKICGRVHVIKSVVKISSVPSHNNQLKGTDHLISEIIWQL